MRRLSQIWIYPVKSLQGIQLSEAHVTDMGLEFDRRWMLVDPHGVFITQREHPVLATLKTSLEPHALTLDWRGARLNVPMHSRGPRVQVRVWRDEMEAVPVGALADDWLRQQIGLDCRLVWMPLDVVRPVDPNYGAPGDQAAFADGFPYLITGEASLRDLNDRLDEPVPMDRFRPNFVFEGGEPFEEDRWGQFFIGDIPFQRVKDCTRCAITTTDQQSGQRRNQEPLRTLAQYRNFGKGIVFGQNLVPRGRGFVRVGDAISF